MMKGLVPPFQRVFLSKSGQVFPRRGYHECSFATHGEPLNVLQYVTDTNNIDNDPPSYLNNNAVRVEMWHAPLNPADINTIEGKYPSPLDDDDATQDLATRIRQSRLQPSELMTVAGSEGWGQVTHVVGDSGGLKVGDTVVVGRPGLGTFRSSFWVPPPFVLSLKHAQELVKESFASQIATVPQLGGTALCMLREFVPLKPGDVVLQNAGNSGVGFMASQIGKQLLDVSVVSIVRRAGRSATEWQELVDYLMADGKAAMVVAEEDLASREAINELKAEMTRLSGTGRLPPLALNAVGGQSASILCKCLDTGGTMVTYGGMSMKPVTIATPQFIFRDLRAVGYWHSRWMVQSSIAARQQLLDELSNAILKEDIMGPPVEEFSLSQVTDALRFNQDDTAIRRKVVFRCQE